LFFNIQAENQRLKQKINSLEKFVLIKDPKIEIKFKGLLTMVDGKVVSALTNQNTCRCNICNNSGTEMNINYNDKIAHIFNIFPIVPS
jgi:hypothetical protein